VSSNIWRLELKGNCEKGSCRPGGLSHSVSSHTHFDLVIRDQKEVRDCYLSRGYSMSICNEYFITSGFGQCSSIILNLCGVALKISVVIRASDYHRLGESSTCSYRESNRRD
jgi:hypothetical protein